MWVERAGGWSRPACASRARRELRHAIERILAPLGRRVDEAEPLCDARLPDGSRVNVVIPPLALDGPALTIRRFRRRGFSAPTSSWRRHVDARRCATSSRARVRARCNVLVSGGTGSGKTTTLNALSAFIGDGERVVTIEDAAELRLQQPHVVRLEARPASVEGRGEVTIRRLVRNALRMRPDRIVVGEVRGAEALDMLSAMSHRPRRLAVDRARRLARGGAAPGRDAGADGGRRRCRTPRCASRSPGRSTSWSPGARAPTARGGSSRSPRSCASPAGAGARELYALRDGRAALARGASATAGAARLADGAA